MQLLAPGVWPEAVDTHGGRIAIRNLRARSWALVLAIVVVLAPVVAPRTAQPASRYALTVAIVDHGTIDLGRYQGLLGIDHAIYRGHLRSDKGPGQPLLGVAAYAMARALGAPAVKPKMAIRGDLSLWWLTVTTATIPFALLCLCMFRRVAKRSIESALVATLSVMIGSIALPHAVNLYAHSLSALFGYAAFCVVADAEPRRGSAMRFVVGGALLGAAVATEYHLAIVAVVVGVVVLRRSLRSAVWLAIGSVPPLAGLAWYQWRAFGAPWHTPFAYYAGTLGGTTKGGYSFPTLSGLNDTLLGNRGVLMTSPILVVAAIAALVLSLDRKRRRLDDVVAVVVFVGYVALVAGWSGTQYLEEPGPRYLIPAIPFLAAPLTTVWPSISKWARLVVAWGSGLMLAAATTFILVSMSDTPVNAYVNRVAHHRFLPTVWSLAFGAAGLWIYGATCGVALIWLRRTGRSTGITFRHKQAPR